MLTLTKFFLIAGTGKKMDDLGCDATGDKTRKNIGGVASTSAAVPTGEDLKCPLKKRPLAVIVEE